MCQGGRGRRCAWSSSCAQIEFEGVFQLQWHADSRCLHVHILLLMCVLMCTIACVILRVHFSDNGMLIITRFHVRMCACVGVCAYLCEGRRRRGCVRIFPRQQRVDCRCFHVCMCVCERMCVGVYAYMCEGEMGRGCVCNNLLPTHCDPLCHAASYCNILQHIILQHTTTL